MAHISTTSHAGMETNEQLKKLKNSVDQLQQSQENNTQKLCVITETSKNLTCTLSPLYKTRARSVWISSLWRRAWAIYHHKDQAFWYCVWEEHSSKLPSVMSYILCHCKCMLLFIWHSADKETSRQLEGLQDSMEQLQGTIEQLKDCCNDTVSVGTFHNPGRNCTHIAQREPNAVSGMYVIVHEFFASLVLHVHRKLGYASALIAGAPPPTCSCTAGKHV